MMAEAPFEIIRTNQSGTFMLACLTGEGVILADGQWKKIRAGQACLLPPFVTNALKCIPGKSWSFAWVRYREARETRPILSSISPVTGTFETAPLKAAIEGLHAECVSGNGSSALHHWSELLHYYVVRFAQPHRSDDRLWRVWQRVEVDLGRSWTLDELAEIACISGEHLRRLCRKELGRSPMHQVTYLRMRRASELLASTEQTIESISHEVGYQNPFVFSNAFTKWIGWRPSEYRRKKFAKP